jgi:hypothetical protein
MDDSRKLMPYEHQLVEALGITKDEYLDFVAQQHIYKDAKEGTVLDIRNDPFTIALVLVVVGTILQVVAALLAKPESPAGQRQSRNDIFAPRSGFNSTQQLAAYGDPINLVYTNIDANSRGGVRVNTALIWSAMKSFGSSQYVQMLLLIGAGGVGQIDYQRTAFGQTPVRDLVSQNYWLYFKENRTGSIVSNHLFKGNSSAKDPGAIGGSSDNVYRVFAANSFSEVTDGFSHAISPSTSNGFGVYAPVPINIQVQTRNESGGIIKAFIRILASSLPRWGASSPSLSGGLINQGEILRIVLRQTLAKYERIVEEDAAEFRRSVSAAFDNAGIMKLGSALFAVTTISAGSTEEEDMIVTLTCTRSGRAPSIPYAIADPTEDAQDLANKDAVYQSLLSATEALLNEDKRPNISTRQDLLNDGRIFQSKYSNGSYTTVFKRALTDEEKQILTDFIDYKKAINSAAKFNDSFFMKALVKVEVAKYETISPCHAVDFAIKGRAWRRIAGRQEKYGSKQREGYRSSDNGIKRRSAMFLVKYKKITLATERETEFQFVKGIFVLSRAADVDNFVYFRFDSGLDGLDARRHWQFEIEPVHDSIAEFNTRNLADSQGKFRFFYIENSGKGAKINNDDGTSILFTGRTRFSTTKLPPVNKSPRGTNEWDLFSHTSDTQLQMSFDQGPEFTITAVTEQIRTPFVNFPGLYGNTALMGFNMYSGRNVQDLRSLSVFVEKGRRSRLLRTSGTVGGLTWGDPSFEYLPSNVEITSSSVIPGTSYYITALGNTNWTTVGVPLGVTPEVGLSFEAKQAVAGTGKVRPGGHPNTVPDIFLDTILDRSDGIGQYAGGLFSIDLEQLSRSKKFCKANNLLMDGVIAEPTSWRQFWADNAGFSLLELAKQDGKESLIPALPYNRSSGSIARQVQISALFTPGNILEDSYKEEFIDYGNGAEDIIATIVYRDNERDGAFPRNNSVDVMLASTQEASAFRETVDASAFVTRRQQAILLGKFLCQTRRHSRRAIEFKTFPTDSFVAPGSYIYVELAQNQWNQIQTGIIGTGGLLNLPFGETIQDGSYQVLLYNPALIEQKTVYRASEPVAGGTAAGLRNFKDYVFVLGQAIRNKRVFRVTEVSMDEEGEVTIKAVEHSTDENGLSRISEGLGTFVSGLFLIDGAPEQQ